MTRYALARQMGDNNIEYLAACYHPSGNGVVYTPLKNDACTYATIEKAVEVLRALQQNLLVPFMLQVIEE